MELAIDLVGDPSWDHGKLGIIYGTMLRPEPQLHGLPVDL